MEKEVKRGYVKWVDENGVFHKEPLADHQDLLWRASPEEQLRAEEVKRLNAAAEEAAAAAEQDREKQAREALEALKKAPEDVLTVAQLTEEEPTVVTAHPEEDAHEAALAEFRERTSE